MGREGRYTVGEAAQAVGATSETLRHYDRIGLVKPSCRDAQTGYRYYSPDDLVRLDAAIALRGLSMSTRKVRDALDSPSLDGVIALLEDARRTNAEQIQQLLACQDRVERALSHYAKLQQGTRVDGQQMDVRELDLRVILLAEAQVSPTAEDLYGYLRHFVAQVGDEAPQYRFRDAAGIFLPRGGLPVMFAECVEHGARGPLLAVPGGAYRCCPCATDELDSVRERLRKELDSEPAFCIARVVLDGILRWHYEVQMPAEGQLARRIA